MRYDMGSASLAGSLGKNDALAWRVPEGQGAPCSMRLSSLASHWKARSDRREKSAGAQSSRPGVLLGAWVHECLRLVQLMSSIWCSGAVWM